MKKIDPHTRIGTRPSKKTAVRFMTELQSRLSNCKGTTKVVTSTTMGVHLELSGRMLDDLKTLLRSLGWKTIKTGQYAVNFKKPDGSWEIDCFFPPRSHIFLYLRYINTQDDPIVDMLSDVIYKVCLDGGRTAMGAAQVKAIFVHMSVADVLDRVQQHGLQVRSMTFDMPSHKLGAAVVSVGKGSTDSVIFLSSIGFTVK